MCVDDLESKSAALNGKQCVQLCQNENAYWNTKTCQVTKLSRINIMFCLSTFLYCVFMYILFYENQKSKMTQYYLYIVKLNRNTFFFYVFSTLLCLFFCWKSKVKCPSIICKNERLFFNLFILCFSFSFLFEENQRVK